MKKVAHVRELNTITNLPTQVLKVIEEDVTILDVFANTGTAGSGLTCFKN